MKKETKWTRSGDEEGRSDDDCGTPTTLPLFPSLQLNSWLLVGLTALLIMQHATVAALPTSIPYNPNLGGTIDIPSEVEMLLQKERRTEMVYPDEHLTHTRNGYDVDFSLENRTVLKISEKTLEDYNKFIINNCRDVKDENLDTFYIWEHHQFALHLKTKIRSQVEDDGDMMEGEESDEKILLRALLAPDKDVRGTLKSMCKSNTFDIDEDERIRNHKLENEIVNSVFANLYRNGGKGAAFKIHVIPRKLTRYDEEEDEAFGKEIKRVLKR